MLIHSKMSDLIKKYFYDKTIQFYTQTHEISADGGRGDEVKVLKESILCNAKPVTAEILKESFGISINAKLLLTCKIDELIAVGYNFQYHDINYEVVEVLRYDSHLKILCK